MVNSEIDSFNEATLERSAQLLSAFKDKHRGERCVIIGNGSSLNKMDLAFLKQEICFGMNKIYLGLEKWNFSLNYYVAVNWHVIEQSIEPIKAIKCPKFISNRGISIIEPQKDTFFVKTNPPPKQAFSTNPQHGLTEGSTVTYVAMQLAYYMGFQTVVLIGIDHHFVATGTPHQAVIAEADDPNHFHCNYFSKGMTWNLPDLKTSEKYYKIAYANYWLDNRKIIDATVDGKCPVFPKADYKEIFF